MLPTRIPDPDRSISPGADLPWPRITRVVDGATVVREVGVPRQFGVGTLLLITAMYAVLFGSMRVCRCTAAYSFWTGLFFAAVGLGQMLLFKGKQPRRASLIVGVCFVPCEILVKCFAGNGSIPTGFRDIFNIFITGIIGGAI